MRSSLAAAALGVLSVASCGAPEAETDLSQVRCKAGYSLEELRSDLAAVRTSHWPDRGKFRSGGQDGPWRALEGLMQVFENADWVGVTRDAALRMLGPSDGEVAYRDVEFTTTCTIDGAPLVLKRTDKEAYAVESADDRLIYRTGDGHNHGILYTLIFERGRVRELLIQAGY